MLNLTAPEMTVLVGGLRALGANVGRAPHGVFTDRPGALTNDFFVNLLDMGRSGSRRSRWRTCTRARPRHGQGQPDGDRRRPRLRRNSQLRAIAEVYASDDAKQKFVRDFVAAWNKVMNLDRFDLA